MHFVGRMFIDLIVTMFFVGLVGSTVVIIISFVEDFRELLGSDETGHEPAASQSAASAGGTSRAEAK